MCRGGGGGQACLFHAKHLTCTNLNSFAKPSEHNCKYKIQSERRLEVSLSEIDISKFLRIYLK